MTDEVLLTIAKLQEAARGNIDTEVPLLDHAGALTDEQHVSNLSFVSQAIDGSLEETELGQEIMSTLFTAEASDAVARGDAQVASALVGVTEQDLDASSLTLPARLLDRLDRDGALTTVLAAGDPNTGKTNTVWLLTELSRTLWEDVVVLSNAEADVVDVRVTSAHELAVELLERRDVPKVVVIDEGSTHFDVRTNSYAVASQWSPLIKHMSKLGVEVAAVIGHTGKDVDPEVKRLTSLAMYKSAPEVADFFAEWPAESDYPTDRLFGGSLEALEPTSASYDPDSTAPWSWNLREDVFANDLEWPDLLQWLRDAGPAES